jgi:hypothetical protein
MQVRHAGPEDVDVDHLRVRRCFERVDSSRKNRSERPRVFTIKVTKGHDMAPGNEEAEPSHLGREVRKETPLPVFPHLQEPDVCVRAPTEDAVSHAPLLWFYAEVAPEAVEGDPVIPRRYIPSNARSTTDGRVATRPQRPVPMRNRTRIVRHSVAVSNYPPGSQAALSLE